MIYGQGEVVGNGRKALRLHRDHGARARAVLHDERFAIPDRELLGRQARFGRSRLVAFGAGMATLLRAQRRLKLLIEWEGQQHEVRTLTLFVGNNRLQLEQLGLGSSGEQSEGAAADGHVTAVILKPIGTLAMLGLMLRGAIGQLGEASGIERFVCQTLVIKPPRWMGRRKSGSR